MAADGRARPNPPVAMRRRSRPPSKIPSEPMHEISFAGGLKHYVRGATWSQAATDRLRANANKPASTLR